MGQNGANATALQAALGLGAQQGNNLTAGLQALQNLSAQEQAARSGNAGLAIDKSNTAKGQQATAANEKYASDTTYGATALQALASLFWPGSSGGNNTIAPKPKDDDTKPGDDPVKSGDPKKSVIKEGAQKTVNGKAYVYNAGRWVLLGPVKASTK